MIKNKSNMHFSIILFILSLSCLPKKEDTNNNKTNQITETNNIKTDESTETETEIKKKEKNNIINNILNIQDQISKTQSQIIHQRDIRGKLQIDLLGLNKKTSCIKNIKVKTFTIEISSSTEYGSDYKSQEEQNILITIGKKNLFYQETNNEKESPFLTSTSKKIINIPDEKNITFADIENISFQKLTKDTSIFHINGIKLSANNMEILNISGLSLSLSDDNPSWSSQDMTTTEEYLKLMTIENCDNI